MMISVTTRDPYGERRHLTYRTDSLESGLEAINSITSTGEILLRVHLFDETSMVALPPEAFDGQPISEVIAELKKEWRRILQKPVNLESVHRQYLVHCNRAHRSRQEAYVDRLKEAIGQTEQHLSRLPDPATDLPRPAQMRKQLTSTLAQYERQLAVAINRRETMLDEFARLQGW